MPEITPDFIRALAAEGDDFGFEMRVLQVLREASSATIEHGGMYQDPVRHEPRQFDFGVEIFNGRRCVQLAVECKNVFAGAPVVVSGSARLPHEATHDIVASAHGSHREARSLRVGYLSRTLEVRRSQLFTPDAFVGKSIAKLKPPKGGSKPGAHNEGYVFGNDADVFDPWSQAVAHAVAMARSATDQCKKVQNRPAFTITLPIVVVPDGTLWTMNYDEGGNLVGDPQQTHTADIFRGQRFQVIDEPPEFRQLLHVSHFQFRTINGLRKLVHQLRAPDAILWETWFRPDVLDGFLEKLGPQ